jgi:hypothetical protein
MVGENAGAAKKTVGRARFSLACRAQFSAGRIRRRYFVDAFIDAKLKARYEACRKDEARLAALRSARAARRRAARISRKVDAFGRIDPHTEGEAEFAESVTAPARGRSRVSESNW